VNNLIVLNTADIRTFVNVGANTAPETFTFANNLWWAMDEGAGWGGPTYSGGLGVLDAEGRAEADFTLPDGLSPDLAGLVTRHAFVTFTGGSNATFASNPVTIAIEL